jgi:hypothetical protein
MNINNLPEKTILHIFTQRNIISNINTMKIIYKTNTNFKHILTKYKHILYNTYKFHISSTNLHTYKKNKNNICYNLYYNIKNCYYYFITKCYNNNNNNNNKYKYTNLNDIKYNDLYFDVDFINNNNY